MFFHQKFCHRVTLLASLLLTAFTVITDNPSTGEVPLGRGLQCGAAPVNIPVSYWSWYVKSAGEAGSLSGRSLNLSECSNVVAPFLAETRNPSALLHAYQIPGEVSLHLEKARSKLNAPR